MVGKAHDDILTAALLQSAKHPIQVRSIHLHHGSEEWFSLHQVRKVVQERDDLARVMEHSPGPGARPGIIEVQATKASIRQTIQNRPQNALRSTRRNVLKHNVGKDEVELACHT